MLSTIIEEYQYIFLLGYLVNLSMVFVKGFIISMYSNKNRDFKKRMHEREDLFIQYFESDGIKQESLLVFLPFSLILENILYFNKMFYWLSLNKDMDSLDYANFYIKYQIDLNS